MRKIKDLLHAFAETFGQLACKVDRGDATEDEAMAYGCLYVIVAVVIFFVFIFAVVVCRLIWHLL